MLTELRQGARDNEERAPQATVATPRGPHELAGSVTLVLALAQALRGGATRVGQTFRYRDSPLPRLDSPLPRLSACCASSMRSTSATLGGSSISGDILPRK